MLKSVATMKNAVRIQDLNGAELDYYVRMSEAQLLHAFEPAPGVFVAETPLVIKRALDAGYEPISFLTDEECTNADFLELVNNHGDVPLYVGPNSLVSEMVGYKLTRGILCAMRRKKLPSPEEVCEGASRIAVLDDVMNPVNVGAIFRSAAALGIDALILTEGSSDPLYRRASRVGMGAAFQVPWTVIKADRGYIGNIKKAGFTTVAMALKENSVSISDKRLTDARKLAIVLGNEGFGLNDDTIAECDYTAMIPMYHGIDSLNVAAAGAVIFWELCKDRGEKYTEVVK